VPLRRLLVSADRFREVAMRRGLVEVNTFGLRSSALLLLVTSADHLRVLDRPRFFDLVALVGMSFSLRLRFARVEQLLNLSRGV